MNKTAAQEPVALPHDIAVESAILGWCLIDNRQIDTAAVALEPEHFFEPLHQRLFQMICHLAGEGGVTPLIVASSMPSDSGLKELGGHRYLATLAQAAPALPSMAEHAKILKELAMRRDLILIGQDLATNAADIPPCGAAQSLADAATEALLTVGRSTARPVVSPYDTAMESLKEAERIATGEPVPIIKTGLAKLDNELAGFRGGDLIVVAARSGMGKSAFMGTVCLNTARAGIPTLVFSLEMTRRQWVERMICDIAFEDCLREGQRPMWYSRIRNGRLATQEFTRFGEAMGKLHGLPLEIIDDDSLTMQQLHARGRAFKAKHGGLGIVLLDYLQIVPPGDFRGRNREQIVADAARGAKMLAKLLGWPVIVGSQMNESAEQRTKEERRPQASDVRESKSIMNEADLILSPYRLAYFVENRKPEANAGAAPWDAWKTELDACKHRMDLLAIKNRHGRRFEIELYCDMGASAIRDHEPLHAAAQEQLSRDLLENVA